MNENMLGLKREKKNAEAALRSLLNQPLPKLANFTSTPELADTTSRAMSLFKKK